MKKTNNNVLKKKRPLLKKKENKDLETDIHDIIIIGGGINGAVTAAAVSSLIASSSLRVLLIDKGDFCSGTSQESSNLIWGGIKYLENKEFYLVKSLCSSRNRLMRNYPSTIKEIRFSVGIEKNFKYGAFLIFLSTLVYWFLGAFFTKKPQLLKKKSFNSTFNKVINIDNIQGAVEYSDAYLIDNDARFIFNFIKKAKKNGVKCLNYMEYKKAKYDPKRDYWDIELEQRKSTSQKNKKFFIKAKTIINTSGPFLEENNNKMMIKTENIHVFSKGIHLIVRSFHTQEKILTFFADDGRLFFIIPMANRLCLGTTDTRTTERMPQVTKEDRDFVLNNINKRLKLSPPLTKNDIISERCGVRSLVAPQKERKHIKENSEWLNLSRKHIIEYNKKKRQISILGGKLTDCLNVAEETINILEKWGYPVFTNKKEKAKHYYGESPQEVHLQYQKEVRAINLDEYFIQNLKKENKTYHDELKKKDISEFFSERLWRYYDKDAFLILEEIKKELEMQESISVLIPELGLSRAELMYMKKNEMIYNLEDFLRRRTLLAMLFSKDYLKNSKAISLSCDILFEKDAKKKWNEYFIEA